MRGWSRAPRFRSSCPIASAALVVVALISSLGVEAASAAPRWTKPAVVSKVTCSKGFVSGLRAAQNARGDALVAWFEHRCRKGARDQRWRLMAVSRKAGRPWGLPRIIHAGASPENLRLDIALDARGGATIAWTRELEARAIAFRDRALLISTRRPGRRFGRPRIVDRHAAAPRLAANPGGDTVLLWRRFVSTDPSLSPLGRTALVLAAIRTGGASRFGDAQTLSAPGRPGIASVAIAADGTAVASWGGTDGVEAAIRTPQGRFGAATRFSPSNGYQAVDVAGRAAAGIAWTTNDAVLGSHWNGQAFSKPVVSARTSQVPSNPGVLLRDDGRVTVEWDQGSFPNGEACGLPSRYAITSPTQPPGTPMMISPPNGIRAAFASALDATGRPIRVWLQATSVYRGKYNDCSITSSRVGASIDGGPTIHGPEIKGPADVAFATDEARTPIVVGSQGRRVVFSRLPAQ